MQYTQYELIIKYKHYTSSYVKKKKSSLLEKK